MIYNSKNFSPLRSSISPRKQDHFQWILIMWIRFEVLFHNLPFSPSSIINSSSDLIEFEENIKNFLISVWIRPLFTIIPLNSLLNHQIGKFRNIFDTRPCEINDLMVSSCQGSTLAYYCPRWGITNVLHQLKIQERYKLTQVLFHQQRLCVTRVRVCAHVRTCVCVCAHTRVINGLKHP